MDILLIIIGIICLVTGMLGCVLPLLPGPPLAYVGMLLFHFTDRLQFTPVQLVVWAVLVILVQVLDYVIPMLGTKYAGGTSWGQSMPEVPSGEIGDVLSARWLVCFSRLGESFLVLSLEQFSVNWLGIRT